jgi:hypothetical protein
MSFAIHKKIVGVLAGLLNNRYYTFYSIRVAKISCGLDLFENLLP